MAKIRLDLVLPLSFAQVIYRIPDPLYNSQCHGYIILYMQLDYFIFNIEAGVGGMHDGHVHNLTHCQLKFSCHDISIITSRYSILYACIALKCILDKITWMIYCSSVIRPCVFI